MRVKRTRVVAEKKSEAKSEAKSAMDSAVVLAALTGLVYVTAVSYEAGYCRYFSIPISLIVPSTLPSSSHSLPSLGWGCWWPLSLVFSGLFSGRLRCPCSSASGLN